MVKKKTFVIVSRSPFDDDFCDITFWIVHTVHGSEMQGEAVRPPKANITMGQKNKYS